MEEFVSPAIIALTLLFLFFASVILYGLKQEEKKQKRKKEKLERDGRCPCCGQKLPEQHRLDPGAKAG